MEIADLVVVNKFDGEYKAVCRGLQKKLIGALSLTMSKHHASNNHRQNYRTTTKPMGFWHCPVELVSAENEYNIEAIWQHALKFKTVMGPEYLLNRRQLQTRRSMWNYLSAALMRSLQGDGDVHKYSNVVKLVENQLLKEETISGHMAA